MRASERSSPEGARAPSGVISRHLVGGEAACRTRAGAAPLLPLAIASKDHRNLPALPVQYVRVPGGEPMHIDAVTDRLSVHVGRTFGARDVERLQEAFVALGPFSKLDIDFAGVRQCDDAALARLATALTALDRGVVRLRGLSVHQWRLLTYAGHATNRHP
jgi:hypothetical protein